MEITHPIWLLFDYKVKCTLIQKDNGHVTCIKYATSKGKYVNIKYSNKNTILAMIGLTIVNEDPVMCVVIFAAEELTFK